MNSLVKKIKNAKSVVLSTHKECDGDGLGAQIALYHALKKAGKDVRILNFDDVPVKYDFLNYTGIIEIFQGPHNPLQSSDLALVFDTNDERQLSRLFVELKKNCKEVLFIDHHPVLKNGPQPTIGSYIDTAAASTGEIVYSIIESLGIELDQNIAQAIYTSIAFDTQVFRYVRNSPRSHIIASELLKYPIKAEDIHRRLFSTHTAEKIQFLSMALGQIEYHMAGRVAFLKIHQADLEKHGLTNEETRDVIDMIMNIEKLEAAILFRQDQTDEYKVSLRSKGRVEVLSTAEKLGGGGHRWAAGAVVRGDFKKLKEMTVQNIENLLRKKTAPYEPT